MGLVFWHRVINLLVRSKTGTRQVLASHILDITNVRKYMQAATSYRLDVDVICPVLEVRKNSALGAIRKLLDRQIDSEPTVFRLFLR